MRTGLVLACACAEFSRNQKGTGAARRCKACVAQQCSGAQPQPAPAPQPAQQEEDEEEDAVETTQHLQQRMSQRGI